MSAPFTQQLAGGFRIVTADERLAERRGIKGVLAGISGIGKTSQLWTLDAASTLFVNREAGELAVQGWPCDEVQVRDWDLASDLACWIGGPNVAMRDDQPYGAAHYQRVCASFGDRAALAKYATLYVDSITIASRLCLQWAKGQPKAVSDLSGKPDMRASYGLLGQEMISWLTHLQHLPDRNVWLVGIIHKRLDDLNRPYFTLQIEGSKTGLDLPGIVDELVTLAELRVEDGKHSRAGVCTTLNPFGYPAKDRSGRLDTIEAPHFGRLKEKIRRPRTAAPTAQLDFTGPATAAGNNTAPTIPDTQGT